MYISPTVVFPVADIHLPGKFKGAEAMITARVALEDLVEQGFEQLVKNKDHHSKIIATPKAELLPRKQRRTNEMNGT